MSFQDDADRTFLALCIWREARGESYDAKCGVGYSILNRMKSSTWSGTTVMGVIFQRLQYSSLTHSEDPQLVNWPQDNHPHWEECLRIADGVLAGSIESPVGKADSYHDTSIKPPAWAKQTAFVKRIGRLLFYRLGK